MNAASCGMDSLGNVTAVVDASGTGSLSGITAIGAGGYHSLALQQQGSGSSATTTVLGWGWGIYGQVGDGARVSRFRPVQASGLSGGSLGLLAAGGAHSLAAVAPGPPRQQTSAYTYDRLARLTGVQTTRGTGPGSSSTSSTYGYDPVGNRASLVRSGASTAYLYDRADRLVQAGGSSVVVDAVGNTTARGSDTFQYDQANRLVSATVAGVTTTFVYDGDGKRVSSTTGGVTTRSVYDAVGGLPVLLDDGTRSYVWGAQGLAYTVESASGALSVAHADGLGSVRALSDSSGVVVQTYGTDEFGIVDAALTQGSSTQPLSYTGERRDASTGLIDLRVRAYDPSLGRFLQADPLRKSGPGIGGWNRYTYVGNNPINLVDPSGFGATRTRVLDPRDAGSWNERGGGTAITSGMGGTFDRLIFTGGSSSPTSAINTGPGGLPTQYIFVGPTGGPGMLINTGPGPSPTMVASQQFDDDQQALVELAKEARRKGRTTPISQGEADALLDWGNEYKIGKVHDHTSPQDAAHWLGGREHIHIGPVDHIPVA